ncbi:MAG: hypothetical protein H6Q90_2024 [Deltaproteobacteria bacterium]|nr:hypothetical protein [Deltaproteobacteria bacterium]
MNCGKLDQSSELERENEAHGWDVHGCDVRKRAHDGHRMRMALLVLVAVLGCGGGGTGKARQLCERAAKLCGEPTSAKELDECAAEFPELKQLVGEDVAGRFLTCGIEAESCIEIVGCASGLIANLGEDAERGFDKMFPMSKRTGAGRHDRADDRLPAECKRADEVCAPDEPFARSKCKEMVGNIRADEVNKRKLVRCYQKANNCFAFAECTNDMWFELH